MIVVVFRCFERVMGVLVLIMKWWGERMGKGLVILVV